jgi:hypothetical protein
MPADSEPLVKGKDSFFSAAAFKDEARLYHLGTPAKASLESMEDIPADSHPSVFVIPSQYPEQSITI